MCERVHRYVCGKHVVVEVVAYTHGFDRSLLAC